MWVCGGGDDEGRLRGRISETSRVEREPDSGTLGGEVKTEFAARAQVGDEAIGKFQAE